MSSTSETQNTEIRCGTCNKCLAKDGLIQCPRCGNKEPVLTPAAMADLQAVWLETQASALATRCLDALKTRSARVVDQVAFGGDGSNFVEDSQIIIAAMKKIEETGWFVRYQVTTDGAGMLQTIRQSFLISRQPFKPRSGLRSWRLKLMWLGFGTFDRQEVEDYRHRIYHNW